jgi:hypothetical protein
MQSTGEEQVEQEEHVHGDKEQQTEKISNDAQVVGPEDVNALHRLSPSARLNNPSLLKMLMQQQAQKKEEEDKVGEDGTIIESSSQTSQEAALAALSQVEGIDGATIQAMVAEGSLAALMASAAHIHMPKVMSPATGLSGHLVFG